MADEAIMPIIDSRIRVEAIDIAYVKQAKELEKAYFLFVEKLKDPHYAKIIFGLPALLLILFALINIFNIPWQYIAFLVGFYLLIKGFGIEERFGEMLDIKLEGNLGLIASILSAVLIIIVFVIASSAYESKISSGSIVAYAASLDVFVNFIFFIIIILTLTKLLISYHQANRFRLFTTLSLFTSLTAAFLFAKIFLKWIINDVAPFFSFMDVLKYSTIILIVSYILYTYLDFLKKNAIKNIKIEGMAAYNAFGDVIGNVQKIEGENIIIKSQLGKRIELSIDNISDVNENAVKFKQF